MQLPCMWSRLRAQSLATSNLAVQRGE
uniref:Uncharacterized protein n=1 Tax=Arundo donax TaxID=35708 RepID=A0A0A9A573_ARUDO